MKKKMSQPKTEPKTIEWGKVSCCENCGNKEYYESSEMGISHRRFRLCTKCMSELLSSAIQAYTFGPDDAVRPSL